MTEFDTVEKISVWLAETGALSEALLDELSLTRFGYSAHAVFTQVIDRHGRVLDEPIQVSFDFEAIDGLTMHGALTARMLAHPEEINWGLSEVALVRVLPTETGVRFEALWEGDRKVEVTCQRVTLTTPNGSE